MQHQDISPKQKRQLRSQAHKLNPVVFIGKKAITENLVKQLQQDLGHHELLKIQISDDDRTKRAEIIDTLSKKTGAAIIQTIGKKAVLYKRGQENKYKIMA